LRSDVLPFLKETAAFYMEFFRDVDEVFESSPAYAPLSESNADGAKIAKSPLSDFAIAREVFESLIEIAEESGTYKKEIPEWQAFLAKLPPIKTNADGTIKEFYDPKAPEKATEAGKASTAVFYPVFPSTQINDTNELFKQFAKTATERFSYGKHHTSASLARFANLFVRLNQPKQAEDIMAALVSSCAMGNLIFAASDWTGMGIAVNDIWAQYTIESNLILTNAIQEMFIRSDKNTVWILPSCGIEKGELGGFLTRCGVEVAELDWNLSKGVVSFKLKAKKTTTINLRLPLPIKKYKGDGTISEDQRTVSNIELKGGKAIGFDFRV